jgi:S-adenosylmethionine:tRNA-ribosyltransferase-isomerase (queuine synthetase)
MTTAYLKAMAELENLKKENKNLKDLLEQVYEMSCLEDMIDDACSNRNDDEVLLYHLSLKSQILEALDKSSNGKDLAEEPKSPMIVEATKHDGSMVLEKYYKEKNYDTKQH